MRLLSDRQGYRRMAYFLMIALFISGCDLIRMKDGNSEDPARKPVARVNNTYLYQDELEGIAPGEISKEDSTARVLAYVNSWIRKQLLISEAMKTIDINEAAVERKMLDYRYSLIGYEFKNFYISGTYHGTNI